MSAAASGLGGRLSLADPGALSRTQRELFDHILSTAVPWAHRSGFAATTTGGQLIGPFNPSLLNPGLATAFLELQAAEQEHTSLDERVRQVVILTVGAVWRAPYELYAHSRVAQRAGLSKTVITELAGGGEPEQLTNAQTAAHRLARQLSTSHCVDDAVYGQAERIFGESGVFDIAVLAGTYHAVCAILTAFAIPAP
ncbi:carboxymuconolactone decarboxylase family protein [Mycobacterium sp. 852002-40037_SCH5390672]|uniref:carboxymuconolactone decarboxylase family protein n=1 Tax=Mycobacterium sp. 852002-40037_SCH5390672 TaxID=1834089 RepID=UPI0008057D4E|nr:carboxymuconolactone decarboxylase family protein [Mycobacterium sp. 852002-40037_SCH5390672]OBB95285.1 carboxymuconolactone decarboxylase [Mycobacterium sp. 852002-40037_SCH5390672]